MCVKYIVSKNYIVGTQLLLRIQLYVGYGVNKVSKIRFTGESRTDIVPEWFGRKENPPVKRVHKKPNYKKPKERAPNQKLRQKQTN